MRDLVITAVAAVLLALLFVYFLFRLLFSNWRDPATSVASPASGHVPSAIVDAV